MLSEIPYVALQDFVPPVPGNTVLPTVTGTTTRTHMLTTTTGSWINNPTSYTYQWQRDAAGNSVYSNIASATASTYTLVGADVGCNQRCNVTATNAGGGTTVTSNAVGLTGASTSTTPADHGCELCSDGIVVVMLLLPGVLGGPAPWFFEPIVAAHIVPLSNP